MLKLREEQELYTEENRAAVPVRAARSSRMSDIAEDFTYTRPQAPADEQEITVTRTRGRLSGADLDYNGLQTPSVSDFKELSPDLLPTQMTLRKLSTARAPSFEQFERTEKARVAVNSKGKAMIAIYTAAIITLFLIIVFNAMAIMRLSGSNAALSQFNAAAQQRLEQLDAHAASLNDEANLIDRAGQLGMTEGTAQTVNVSLSPEVAPPVYASSSNWFDWIGDILSGLFG